MGKSTSIGLWVGSVLFLVFMLVQFNDFTQYNNADWWSWVLMYLACAILGFLAWKQKLSFYGAGIALGFSIGALCFKLQDDVGNWHWSRLNIANFWTEDGTEMVQQTNETGGLILIIIWLVILNFIVRKSY